MNSKKRIILVSLIGLIALNSVSATLAWFSNSNFLQIDNIVITVDGDRELLISTSDDIDTFKESLTEDELEHVPTYVPVSSMYTSEWMPSKASKPVFYDSSNSLVRENGVPFLRESIYGFYSQELYILSDDDVYVTIDALDTYIKPNSLFNNAYAQRIQLEHPEYTIDEIIEKLNNLTKAMRFSILVPDEEEYEYAVIDPNHNEDYVLFGGVLDNSISRYYDVYSDHGELKEVIYGEIFNRELAVYDEGLSEDSILEGEATAFNARHQKDVKRFNLEKSLENGMEIAKENVLTLSDFIGDPKDNYYEPGFYFPVYRYQPRKIVLSIYIEGWDLDSVNHTMGASFISNLSFKIHREM